MIIEAVLLFLLKLVGSGKINLAFNTNIGFSDFLNKNKNNITRELSEGKLIEITLSEEIIGEIVIEDTLVIACPVIIMGNGNLINFRPKTEVTFISCDSADYFLIKDLNVYVIEAKKGLVLIVSKHTEVFLIKNISFSCRNVPLKSFLHIYESAYIYLEYIEINIGLLESYLISIQNTKIFFSKNLSLSGTVLANNDAFNESNLIQIYNTTAVSIINLDIFNFSQRLATILHIADCQRVIISYAFFSNIKVNSSGGSGLGSIVKFEQERAPNSFVSLVENIIVTHVKLGPRSSFLNYLNSNGTMIFRKLEIRNSILENLLLIVGISNGGVGLFSSEGVAIENCNGLQIFIIATSGLYHFIDYTGVNIVDSPILSLVGSGTIKLEGFILKNNYLQQKPYALFNFKNILLANNSNEGVLIIFEKCVFINNSHLITTSSASSLSSLFIIAEGSIKIFIFSGIFFQNYAQGGNVAFHISYLTEIYMDQVLFIRNVVSKNSFVGEFAGLFLGIRNCVFFENASQNGSGLSFKGENLIYHGNIFVRNKARLGVFLNIPNDFFIIKKTIIKINALICAQNQVNSNLIFVGEIKIFTIYLNNSILFKNSAKFKAGVFGFYCTFVDVEHYTFISNSLFAINEANSGGVLHFENYNCSLLVENSIAVLNHGLNSGGLVSTYSGNTINITNIRMYYFRNIANEGAVIFANGGSFLLVDCTFDFNFARIASSIYATGGSSFILIRCNIFNSFANHSGNLVFTYRCNIILIKLLIQNSSSMYKSAAISSVHRTRISALSCVFDNISSFIGTVIHLTNCYYPVLLMDCTFKNIFSEKSIIHIFFSDIWLIGNSIGNTCGNLFKITNSGRVFISKTRFFSILCLKEQYGCFLKSNTNGSLLFINSSIIGVESINSENLISISDSSLMLFKVDINSLKRQAFYFFQCSNSHFIILSSNLRVCQSVFFKGRSSTLALNSNNFELCDDSTAGCQALSLYGSDVIVSHSSFIRFTASAIFMEGEIQKNRVLNNLIIAHSMFIENSGVSGGALILNKLNALVQNSVFSENKAQFWGGCAFLACEIKLVLINFATFNNAGANDSIGNCLFLFFNNTFELNVALKGGGVVFWRTSSLPVIFPPSLNYFYQNKSPYGDVVGSHAVYFELENKETLKSLNKIESGVIFNESLNFTVRDFYNQVIFEHEEAEVRIRLVVEGGQRTYLGFETNSFFFLGRTSVVIEKGRFSFENFRLIALPTSTLSFFFESNMITACKQEFLNSGEEHCPSNSLYSKRIPVVILPCMSGQVFQSSKLVCSFCGQGTYTFEPKNADEICNYCPLNTKCLGGSAILTNKGYWRAPNSSNIYKCQNPYSCIGGAENICLEGFSGNLCHVCQEPGQNETEFLYFMDIDKKCKICSNWYIAKAAIISSLILIILICYLIVAIRKRMKSKESASTVMLKIMTDYIQNVSLITDFSSGWIDNLGALFIVQSTVNDPNILFTGLECEFGSFLPKLNLIFKRIFMTSVLSLSIPLIIYVVWLVIARVRNLPKEGFMYSFSTSLVIVFDTLQPSFMNFFFSALTCQEIEGKNYIAKYPTQECWTPVHNIFIVSLVAPCLLLWMILMPLYLYSKIWTRMNKKLSLEAYSYLTFGYKERFFYWDIILMANKYIFILGNTFIKNEVSGILGFFMVNFIFLFLQFFSSPYESKTFNQISFLSKSASHSLLACSMIFATVPQEVLTVIIFLTACFSNIVFFLYWILIHLRMHGKILELWNKICFCSFLKLSKTEILSDYKTDSNANSHSDLFFIFRQSKKQRSTFRRPLNATNEGKGW